MKYHYPHFTDKELKKVSLIGTLIKVNINKWKSLVLNLGLSDFRILFHIHHTIFPLSIELSYNTHRNVLYSIITFQVLLKQAEHLFSIYRFL